MASIIIYSFVVWRMKGSRNGFQRIVSCVYRLTKRNCVDGNLSALQLLLRAKVFFLFHLLFITLHFSSTFCWCGTICAVVFSAVRLTPAITFCVSKLAGAAFRIVDALRRVAGKRVLRRMCACVALSQRKLPFFSSDLFMVLPPWCIRRNRRKYTSLVNKWIMNTSTLTKTITVIIVSGDSSVAHTEQPQLARSFKPASNRGPIRCWKKRLRHACWLHVVHIWIYVKYTTKPRRLKFNWNSCASLLPLPLPAFQFLSFSCTYTHSLTTNKLEFLQWHEFKWIKS